MPYQIDIDKMNNIILHKISNNEKDFLIKEDDGVYKKQGKKYYLKSKYRKNK